MVIHIEQDMLGGVIRGARLEGCSPCTMCPDISFDFVPPKGPEYPALYIVGEAPGKNEALRGVPLVGKEGALLDTVLRGCGVLHSARIFTAVACRPMDKYRATRTPTECEVTNCSQFVKEDIRCHRPDVLMLLGKTATRAFFPEHAKMKLGAIRDLELTYLGVPVQVTYHPAYVLRTGGVKGEAYAKFLSDVRLCVEYINYHRGIEEGI